MQTSEERRAQIIDCLKRRKKRLKSIGLCQDCGNNPARKEHTLCLFCLDSRRRLQQDRARKAKAAASKLA
jgi:hypothetical protein